MIVALYGPSSSGKTTIAISLRQHLGDCPVRHCGEMVKARARGLSVSLNDLRDEEHRIIDADTRAWCEAQHSLAIVEGRYLHYVLSRTGADVRLIEVVCDRDERARRWAKRMGCAFDADELNAMDAAGWCFAAKMYTELSPLAPRLRVDSTFFDVYNCVQRILDWLNRPSPC